jgi:hypothetical protein
VDQGVDRIRRNWPIFTDSTVPELTSAYIVERPTLNRSAEGLHRTRHVRSAASPPAR